MEAASRVNLKGLAVPTSAEDQCLFSAIDTEAFFRRDVLVAPARHLVPELTVSSCVGVHEPVPAAV